MSRANAPIAKTVPSRRNSLHATMAEAPADAPAAEEPAPTPSWTPFVASVAAPRGYSLDTLLAAAAEDERFTVVDVDALAKGAADAQYAQCAVRSRRF